MTYKTYDELFNAILVAFAGAGSSPVTPGSDKYIRAAGLASSVWGLYRELAYVEGQIFEDTADDPNLIRHASSYGIIKAEAESFDNLLRRLQERKKHPPSGGNRYDFRRWALETTHEGEVVEEAVCYPNGRGIGTSVVACWNRDNSAPSAQLLSAIYAHIMDVCSVAPREVYIIPTTDLVVNVSITMVGGSISLAEQYLRAYVDDLAPGELLALGFIWAFCIQAKATSVTVHTPTGDVLPTEYARVRLGTVEWL